VGKGAITRAWLSGLLLLAGCDGSTDDESATVETRPAAITFDGANYKTDPAKLAHGERLTYVLGCRGCHGKQLEGQKWDDDPKEYGVMWASNLTRAVPTMSDAQLAALLTTGVHPKRADLWVMPSELFQHLSKADLDALIAFLRTVPPAGELSPDPVPGPVALRQIESGEIKNAAAMVRDLKSVGPVDLGKDRGLGRYITRVTCAECHGPELMGRAGDTPDLITAGAYSRADFEKLVTQGVPTGNRKLHELMQSVAKSRFSHLTSHERDALYAYLKARAEQPQ
jgi:mono/diheme cytochrome c family protein